jgi:beta-lactamase regulating signal transducer with metallopeptidase domain/uncharacterized GH25 family protein
MADVFAGLWSWFGDDFSVRWLVTALHFLWQGAVVGVVAAIAARQLREASARSRYALYAAALLSLPVCTVVTFLIVQVPVAKSASQLESHDDIPVLPSASPARVINSRVAVERQTPAAMTESRKIDGVVTNDQLSREIREEVSSKSQTQSSLPLVSRAAPWVAEMYVLGVIFFLLRLMIALWGGHRLRTQAIRVTDANLLRLMSDQAARLKVKVVPILAYCERVAVPTVVGVLRPMILLPASLMTGLPPDDFAAIIRHELAHVRRYDLWMNLLQRIIESLLFFHPAVWFVSRRLSAEREICCDELVVSSGCEPMHYAGALLRMAELCAISGNPGILTLAATDGKTSLFERRIKRLMNCRTAPRLQLNRTGIAGLLFTFVSIFAVLGMAHTWAKDQAADGESKTSAQSEAAPASTKQVGLQTLRDPAFRLPDHWILLAVGFDKNGKELVTVSTQSVVTIRRWDVAQRKLICEIKLASDKPGRSFRHETLKLSGDCRRVIAATDDYVGIWDTATGKLLKTLPFPKKKWEYDCIRFLACTPDLSVIAGSLGTSYDRTTLVYDGHTIVWDGNSGEVLQTITHKNATYIISIALSSDGKLLATTNGGGASIWDTATGDLRLSLRNENSGRKHPDPEVTEQYINHVWSLGFSPDGKQIAVGDILGVRIWDTQTGELLRQLEGAYRYSSGDARLIFSSDGRLLARTGTKLAKNYTVPIWSTQTGEKLYELQTEADDGSFSDDNHLFAVGFSDFRMGLAVFQLGGTKLQNRNAAVPESSIDKVAENTHYRGRKADEFIDNWKPAWGEPKLGIQCGIAVTRQQRQFHNGERVPLAIFIRNVGDKPLEIDTRPDFFWESPRVVDTKNVAIEFEKVALLGTPPHYRDKLAPGEAFGPLYLNFGLGENPRPGKQNWSPYNKSPVAGKYNLTHTLAINVADPNDSDESKKWKPSSITTGQIDFEIVEGGSTAAHEQPENSAAATQSSSRSDDAGPRTKSWRAGQVMDFRLISAQTQKPIAGAKLELQNMGPGINFQDVKIQITDADGRSAIKLPDLPPTAVRVYPIKEGFVPLRVYWEGEPSPVMPKSITIAMEPAKTFGGTIRNEAGEPIPNVAVNIHYWAKGSGENPHVRANIDAKAKSDKNGRWQVNVMPAKIETDEMRIFLTHPDYVSDHLSRAIIPIPVTEQPPLKNLFDQTAVMIMRKGNMLQGRVVDEDGQSISNAKIHNNEYYWFGSKTARARTDRDGNFQIAGVDPGGEQLGRYDNATLLTIEAAGYAPELVNVVPDSRPQIQLKPGKMVEGRVIDENGKPVKGASVSARRWREKDNRLHLETKSDAEGNFRLSDVPVDDVEYDIGKDGYLMLEHFPMSPGHDKYSVTLKAPLKIIGSVVDAETGKPIEKFSFIEGFEYGDGRAPDWQRYKTKKISNGKYEMTIIQERFSYRVRIEADGYMPGESRPFQAYAPDKGTVTFDFKLRKAPPLAGTVVGLDGKPLAGANVYLATQLMNLTDRKVMNDRDHRIAKTDEAGRFTFAAEVEPYCLVVVHEQGIAMLTEKDFGSSQPISLEPWTNENQTLQIVRRPAPGQLVHFPR